MKTQAKNQIGRRVAAARAAKGLSLRTLGEACGLRPNTILDVESGATEPTLATLRALATGLGVSLVELVGE